MLQDRDDDPNPWTEFEIDLDKPIPEEYYINMNYTYDPNAYRDYPKSLTSCVAAREIVAGEELLDNYIAFGGEEHFEEMVLELRDQCSGQDVGGVEKYQRGEYIIEQP